MQNNSKCFILSGVPGAGKSTWIQNQSWFKESTIYSADSFFTKDGIYKLDPSKELDAHNFCLREFIRGCHSKWEALQLEANTNTSIVVVDNINSSVEEIAPYYAIAKAYGYDVELITLLLASEIAYCRNIHNVYYNRICYIADIIKNRNIPPYWDMECSTYVWKQEKKGFYKTDIVPQFF
jgi:predicted kinase